MDGGTPVPCSHRSLKYCCENAIETPLGLLGHTTLGTSVKSPPKKFDMLKCQSPGAAAIGALSVLRVSTPPLMNGSNDECSVEKIVDVSLP